MCARKNKKSWGFNFVSGNKIFLCNVTEILSKYSKCGTMKSNMGQIFRLQGILFTKMTKSYITPLQIGGLPMALYLTR